MEVGSACSAASVAGRAGDRSDRSAVSGCACAAHAVVPDPSPAGWRCSIADGAGRRCKGGEMGAVGMSGTDACREAIEGCAAVAPGLGNRPDAVCDGPATKAVESHANVASNSGAGANDGASTGPRIAAGAGTAWRGRPASRPAKSLGPKAESEVRRCGTTPPRGAVCAIAAAARVIASTGSRAVAVRCRRRLILRLGKGPRAARDGRSRLRRTGRPPPMPVCR